MKRQTQVQINRIEVHTRTKHARIHTQHIQHTYKTTKLGETAEGEIPESCDENAGQPFYIYAHTHTTLCH